MDDCNGAPPSSESNGSRKAKKSCRNGKSGAASQTSGSAQRSPTLYKLSRLLDLNLKFDSAELESAYQKSYLAVTRHLFLNYLLFLIVFCTCWAVFFSLDVGTAADHSHTLSATLNKYTLRAAPGGDDQPPPLVLLTSSSLLREYMDEADVVRRQALLNASNAYLFNELTSARPSSSSSSSIFIVCYLALIALVFVVMFACVLLIEINETRYKHLEKKIAANSMQKTVDTKVAERDLKLAMADIVTKESEIGRLNDQLNARSEKVNALRSFYGRVAHLAAYLCVTLMFVLCFAAFGVEPARLTLVDHFVWFCEATLLVYLMYPFKMLISIACGLVLSLAFEALTLRKQLASVAANDATTATGHLVLYVLIKLLLHAGLHLIAFYLKLSLQGVKRDTFLKVTHNTTKS